MSFSDWLHAARSAGFPRLDHENCQPTSPADESYNCIAWAAQDSERWWWPDPLQQDYWPPAVPRTETLDAFVLAFEFLGYCERTDGKYELGKEKIAIFANEYGKPQHAARQLQDGNWTSKLGPQIDISHDLLAIEGPAYGTVRVILARPSAPTKD